MDFDSVADELHVVPRSEFVATRDRRCRQAREQGDPETAERIATLRKPTVAAWLLNLLAHERPEPLQRYLALGDSVRGGSGLQEFASRRRDLLQELLGEVESVAGEHDQPLNSGTTQEITDTLNRALADIGAAGTVRAGRLSSALPASEDAGGQWLANVAAQHGSISPHEEKPSRRSRSEQPGRSGRPRTSTGGGQRGTADRQRQEAERALDQAQRRLDRAERDAEQASREAEERRRDLDSAERHREQADEAVRAARSDRDAAAKKARQRRK